MICDLSVYASIGPRQPRLILQSQINFCDLIGLILSFCLLQNDCPVIIQKCPPEIAKIRGRIFSCYSKLKMWFSLFLIFRLSNVRMRNCAEIYMDKNKALADRLDFSGKIVQFKNSQDGGVSLIFLIYWTNKLVEAYPSASAACQAVPPIKD